MARSNVISFESESRICVGVGCSNKNLFIFLFRDFAVILYGLPRKSVNFNIVVATHPIVPLEIRVSFVLVKFVYLLQAIFENSQFLTIIQKNIEFYTELANNLYFAIFLSTKK